MHLLVEHSVIVYPAVTAVICAVLYCLGSQATVNLLMSTDSELDKRVQNVSSNIVILHYRPVMFRHIRKIAKGDY